MSKWIRYFFKGIVYGALALVLNLLRICAAGDGTLVLEDWLFAKWLLGAVVIGIGFTLPCVVYESERISRAAQGMIQLGIGCTVLLLVSYVEGWIPTLKAILPTMGVAVLVWLGFTLYYRWEANCINRKIRESSAKE